MGLSSPQQFILGLEMKWTLCLLCVASVTTALPARDKRGFSLFSVVTFPNEPCTTTMTPAMTGICVTSEECTNSGDIVATASGNCASGFGVCCFRSTEAENAAITQDVVHIQSAGFPSNEATLEATAPAPSATTRAYTIMGGANICQIRLDLMAGTALLDPAAGACPAGESITIATSDKTSVQNGITGLCGALGDQHLYVDVSTTAAAMAATLNVDTAGTSGARKWKILVRQVECNNEDLRAPSGCRQYHTATSGRISSFNGANSVTTTNGQYLLRGTRYNICIRKATGMTGVTLREAGGGSDSFKVMGAIAASGVGVATCTTDFLSFAGERYCGGVLAATTGQTVAAPVTGNAFTIGVVSTADSTASSGFDLIYNQHA